MFDQYSIWKPIYNEKLVYNKTHLAYYSIWLLSYDEKLLYNKSYVVFQQTHKQFNTFLQFACFSVAKATLESQMSVCPSVRNKNPSASQNHSYRAYQPSSLSTIEPINHRAYRPSSLLTIEHIDHRAIDYRAYQPLILLTIESIDHQVYWPSSLSTIEPINRLAYQPLSLPTLVLLSRLLSLLACLDCRYPQHTISVQVLLVILSSIIFSFEKGICRTFLYKCL